MSLTDIVFDSVAGGLGGSCGDIRSGSVLAAWIVWVPGIIGGTLVTFYLGKGFDG